MLANTLFWAYSRSLNPGVSKVQPVGQMWPMDDGLSIKIYYMWPAKHKLQIMQLHNVNTRWQHKILDQM